MNSTPSFSDRQYQLIELLFLVVAGGFLVSTMRVEGGVSQKLAETVVTAVKTLFCLLLVLIVFEE